MRLIGLVNHLDHVSGRYRLRALRTYLSAHGIDLELRRCPRYWIPGWNDRTLGEADAVILQRRLLSGRQLRQLRKQCRRLIYDFDDALFLNDSYDPRGLHSPDRFTQFRDIVQSADLVVAGNAFLRDQVQSLVEPSRVALIPTCLEPRKYGLAQHRRTSNLRLAWIGSASTLQGLVKIRPMLEAIGRAIPGLRLKIICDRSLTLDHVAVDFCPWSEASEAHHLADADVGISWLPGDTWSQGKCGLKVLQYMAAGLPVLANPVGVQADLVRCGENGLLAESTQEWIEALTQLAGDPQLRRHMGTLGRERVEQEFHIAAGAAAWVQELHALMQRSTSPVHVPT